MQFLHDLEQIFFKCSTISLTTDLVVLGLVNKIPNHISETRMEPNYVRENKENENLEQNWKGDSCEEIFGKEGNNLY